MLHPHKSPNVAPTFAGKGPAATNEIEDGETTELAAL